MPSRSTINKTQKKPADTDVEPRPVGRPRSKESEEKILNATLFLMGKHGFPGLTVDEVVAVAGVSKSTVYRRWATKEELAIAALDRLPPLVATDTGNLIEDLLDIVEQYSRILHDTPLRSVLPALISEATKSPKLAQDLLQVVTDRRGPVLATTKRAIARGDLPARIDIALAVELFMAPMLQRSLFSSEPFNLSEFRKMYGIIINGLKR